MANDIFFSLLRAGLYGSPINESELPERIDWESVVVTAQKQCVLGIIIDGIQYLPESLRPTGSLFARLNKFALGLIQANIIVDKTAAKLVDFLSRHDVHGVLLKGQGVARYYRIPQMRQNGDIDFYVGKRQYKRAVDACLEGLVTDRKECHETVQHFDFDLDRIPIELHRLASRVFTPIRSKRFQKWVEEELESEASRRVITVDSTELALPSYDFDAIFIFYHAWLHFIMGGIGLRQLCDWTMIFQSHSHEINREQLERNLSRFGMTKGWKLFGCIVVKYLGLTQDKMPLFDPNYMKGAEKIFKEIMAGGNFGYYSEAFSRAKAYGSGVRYGFEKIRTITDYFFSLFPLIPAEATFLTINRLVTGTLDNIKRARRK